MTREYFESQLVAYTKVYEEKKQAANKILGELKNQGILTDINADIENDYKVKVVDLVKGYSRELMK